MNQISAYKTFILFFTFIFLWSTGFITTKIGLGYMLPFQLLFFRYLTAFLILFALYFVLKLPKLTRNEVLHQFITGIFFSAGIAGMFLSIKNGFSPGLTSLIMGIQPILTAVIGFMIFQEKMTLKQILGMIVGFISITFILVSPHSKNHAFLLVGFLFNLLGLFSFTIGTIYQKKMGSNHHPVCALFWQVFVSVIIISILGLSLYGHLMVHFDIKSVSIIVWQGIVINIFSWALLIHLLKKYSATTVASLLLIVPALTTLESWIIFDQNITLLTSTAIFTTILGVYLVVRPPKKKKSQMALTQ